MLNNYALAVAQPELSDADLQKLWCAACENMANSKTDWSCHQQFARAVIAADRELRGNHE